MSYTYRYRCVGETFDRFETRNIEDPAPTVCPDNPAVAIIANTLVIVSSVDATTLSNTAYINSITGGKQLLTGSASYVSGMTYNVTELTYIINNVFYTSPGGQVTLAAAHPTLNRIDVIYADTSGNIGVITGTAAASPIKPEVSFTQIEVTIASITAAAISPTVTIDNVYNENLGTGGGEWNTTESTSGVRINVDSTASPQNGTKSIDVTGGISGDYIQFTAASYGNPGTVLELNIKSKSVWAGNLRFRLAFFSASTRVSNWIEIYDGVYGFNSSNTSTYQTIAIPKFEFNVTESFNIIKMEIQGSGGNSLGFYLDRIRFQSDIDQNPPSGEIATASNVNLSGVGVFKQKVGTNFEYKGIDTTSNRITVSDDAVNNTVDLTLNEGNIVHQNLSGVGSYTHSQIDSHINATNNPHVVTINQVSPVTTKGDLIARDATNSVRLAVGVNNTVLVADSAAATGIKWTDDLVLDTISITGSASFNSSTITGLDPADVGLSNVTNTKNNFTAIVAPAVTDDTAAGYSLGSRWINTVTDKHYVCVDATNGAAVWIETIAVASAIFGSQYEYFESLGETTTTSTTAVNKVNSTTASKPIGTYKVSWSWEWATTVNSQSCEARAIIDKGTGSQNIVGLMRTAPHQAWVVTTNEQYEMASGFANVTFGSAATHTLTIDFRTSSGTSTARIRRARIEIHRIS